MTDERREIAGSRGNRYILTKRNGKWSCTCRAFMYRKTCKHVDDIINNTDIFEDYKTAPAPTPAPTPAPYVVTGQIQTIIQNKKRFLPTTQPFPRILTITEFIPILTRINDNNSLNPEQQKAVLFQIDSPCFIVAGPGSGKTTVIVYRIFKFLFMDGILPEEILATTFTKKAARELKGRIIEKGYEFIQILKNQPFCAGNQQWLDAISRFDLNRIIVGTLDSICDEVIIRSHLPEQPPANVVDEIVAKGLFRKEVFWRLLTNDPNRGTLEHLLKEFTAKVNNNSRVNLGDVMNLLKTLHDKRIQESITLSDFENYLSNVKREDRMLVEFVMKCLHDFREYLVRTGTYDYAMLEEKFLEIISDPNNPQFPHELKVILVDEYQDTNYLQEQIYFNLTKRTGCGKSITIVGDDDQSMYRFRGAVVNLIKFFPERIKGLLNLPQAPDPIYLMTNYRSTENIIDFYNAFLCIDPSYISGNPPARIDNKPLVSHPSKPNVIVKPQSPPATQKPHPNEYPVLLMLRDSVEQLAEDLSKLITNVFSLPLKKSGQSIPGNLKIQRGRNEEANYRDLVFLCSTPQETSSTGKETITARLRSALEQVNIPVFNPRGSDLYDVPEVQQLLGLLMLCLDPDSVAQDQLWMPDPVKEKLNQWRATANDLLSQHADLTDFVDHWQQRKVSKIPAGRKRASLPPKWPSSFPVLELLYKLASWIEVFEDDPEYMLYLEAVVNLLEKISEFSSWNGEFVREIKRNGVLTDVENNCVKSYFRDFFIAIANKELTINEDLIDIFPEDRVNIMSIHQSKGLEFPLVIVDVCSSFESDSHFQRFRRFPKVVQNNHALEEYFQPIFRSPDDGRTPLDHSFDDLVRLYFVAYSRAQSLLLLVGINPKKGPYMRNGEFIPNVAVGYDRNENHIWSPRSGNPPWILI